MEKNNFDISAATRSVRDVVYEKLKEAILSGVYLPGAQLKERSLAEQFNISTTPLKEALRQLEREGLVETVPRIGTFIPKNIMVSIEEVMLVRAALEGVGARLAALKATADEVKELAACIADMERETAGQNREALVQVNNRFHEMVSRFSKNNYIIKQVAVTRGFSPKTVLFSEGEEAFSFQDHHEVYLGIVHKDPDRAEAGMKRHILRSLKVVQGQGDSTIN